MAVGYPGDLNGHHIQDLALQYTPPMASFLSNRQRFCDESELFLCVLLKIVIFTSCSLFLPPYPTEADVSSVAHVGQSLTCAFGVQLSFTRKRGFYVKFQSSNPTGPSHTRP